MHTSSLAERLYRGLRLSDEAEPVRPPHHPKDRIPPKGDECPKRAAYINKVVARYKAQRKARGGLFA